MHKGLSAYVSYLNACGLFLIKLLCLVWLAACSEPRLQKLHQASVILAFGDSLTFGTGVSEEYSYPSVLQLISGVEVVNAGVPGETTAQGLARLPNELDRYAPDLLILLEGGNDILRNIDPELTKANLESMVSLAAEYGISVVLLGVPEKKLFSNSAPLYGELADAHGLVYDGDLIAGLMRSAEMKSDAVHFNAKGYRAMAESIYALLITNGAL